MSCRVTTASQRRTRLYIAIIFRLEYCHGLEPLLVPQITSMSGYKGSDVNIFKFGPARDRLNTLPNLHIIISRNHARGLEDKAVLLAYVTI
jgi:hypothetical protein